MQIHKYEKCSRSPESQKLKIGMEFGRVIAGGVSDFFMKKKEVGHDNLRAASMRLSSSWHREKKK
jgi:hypothetical protein